MRARILLNPFSPLAAPIVLDSVGGGRYGRRQILPRPAHAGKGRDCLEKTSIGGVTGFFERGSAWRKILEIATRLMKSDRPIEADEVLTSRITRWMLHYYSV